MRRASALAARLFSLRLRASEQAIKSIPCAFFLLFISFCVLHQFSSIGRPCGRIGLFGGGHARRLRCWPVANQWVMPASTRRDSACASPEGEDRPVDDRFRLAGSDSVVTVASNRCVAESESAQPIARPPA